QKLDRLIDHVFELFLNKPALALVFVNEQNHLLLNQDNAFLPYYDRFLELAQEILIEGTERGVFRKNIDLRIIRLFFFGGIRYLIHQWAQNPEQISLQSICQQVKSIVREGILITPPSHGLT
ncbi:MAG TPA: TetR/AcrR family transcriptional regulator C-terminal domain-containing protein, partial [bacterium]|nr:TetR/AcrR family transcriptional regulator C-terminal domain-containing protein [bacterium]